MLRLCNANAKAMLNAKAFAMLRLSNGNASVTQGLIVQKGLMAP